MQHTTWLRHIAAVSWLALAATACGAADDEEPVEPIPAPAVPLHIGYVLPESGPLAFQGPPQIQAVRLAVDDMNSAMGVLGEAVLLSGGDESGDATVAAQTAQRLIGEGVHAIVGAAASTMSLAFADAVTSAGVLQCSASNTAPTFTDADFGGMYFRTASTDALQGPVLAATILADGHTNPAVLARDDDYGRGLLEATVAELESEDADVAMADTYDPEALSFDDDVTAVVDSDADSVAIIAFDEGAQILREMAAAGLSPRSFPIYGADGSRSNELAELVDPDDPGVLEGMRGTAPSPQADPVFLARFETETDLEDATFAAQAYDCTILIGLSAIAAGSAEPVAMAAELVGLTRDGAPCGEFAECVELLEAGEDIEYQTKSGVQLSETATGNGEPDSGQYEIWEIDGNGRVTTIETVVAHF